MYAIVEINGQQFKAEAGKKLFVHHIQNVENGATVEFEKVLLVEKDGAITVGAPVVEGAKVVAEVKSELVKGEKVLVFHKKRRKGHRKLNGHRQQFSEIIVKEVIAKPLKTFTSWHIKKELVVLRTVASQQASDLV